MLSVVGAAANVSVTLTVRVSPPPVTVIVPVLVPTAAVAVSMATVRVLLFEPLAGLTASQLTASVTLHDAFDVIDSDWAAGLVAPCVPVKVRLEELTANVGVGAVSVSVTLTVRVSPPPVTVIVPVLVPTTAVAVSTATVRVPLFEPLAGLTASQLTASVTVHDAFDVIDSDWAAGLVAPCVPVNVKVDEPTVNVGVGALSVSVMLTVRVSPPPVTVIAPVLVPTVAVAVSTATVRVPLFEPLAGLTASQLTASVTVHDAFDVIDSDWAAGLVAPCVPVNVKVDEPTVNV